MAFHLDTGQKMKRGYIFDGTRHRKLKELYEVADGTRALVYRAEEALPDLTVSDVLNYNEAHTTTSGTSGGSWDLSGFDELALSWSLSTSMSWSNPYGVVSTTTVYLRLADGSTVRLGSKNAMLWTAGSVYTASGTVRLDLTGYTAEQLADVRLYVTLGDMNAPAPQTNADRHAAHAAVTNVIAS